jgi:hypothetical protein
LIDEMNEAEWNSMDCLVDPTRRIITVAYHDKTSSQEVDDLF